MQKKAKILIWDIETSHDIVATFGLYNDSIPPENIMLEWYVICASWKWLGEDEIHSVSVMDDGMLDDDTNVLLKMAEVLEEADMVVAHNGDRFDIKKINTRGIFHGMSPFSKKLSVDTLKVAKRHFKFTSNRLDYIAQYLGVGSKMSTSKGLWLRVLTGDTDAIKEMVEYNKVDVDILEKVYLKLRPWMDNHPSVRLLAGDTTPSCTACGSVNIQWRGWMKTRTSHKHRYQCQECGKWDHDKKSVLTGSIR